MLYILFNIKLHSNRKGGLNLTKPRAEESVLIQRLLNPRQIRSQGNTQ